MVFSSLLFLFRFLPLVFVLYLIAPRKLKNGVLLGCSLIFYAWGEPLYVSLMVFSILMNFVMGHFVQKYKDLERMKTARRFVIAAVVVNLVLLGFFKYADFASANLNALFGTSIPALNLALPIGISFYTFQSISYPVDIYRGAARAQASPVAFGMYVSFFPQLIAGPIVQYNDIAEQLEHRKETADGFAIGAGRFVCGLTKKVLIANNAGLIWNTISARPSGELSLLAAWLGMAAFALQIYFDFSGYSDMAIGLGRMFGFRFLENFNYPYQANSITDFWRRWHISLSSWFRDYVYIPLGGNRHGLIRQLFNILIVWALTGIWHGASWNFLAWGAYFGLLLLLEKLFLLKWLDKLPGFFRHIYALLAVAVGWAVFAFDSLSQGASYIRAMFGLSGAGLWDQEALYLLYTNGFLLAIALLGSTRLPVRLFRWAKNALTAKPGIFAAGQCAVMAAFFLLSVAYLVDASYNPFLYFRF